MKRRGGMEGERRADRPQDPCERIQERLWPLDTLRVWSAEDEADRDHLRRCETCRAFFRRDAAVSRALGRHGLAARAPAELRERIFDLLARERALRAAAAYRWPRLSAWAAAAGALALLLAFVFAPRPPAASGDPFIQDFMTRAVEQEVVHSPNVAAVSRFFLREMGMTVRPVMLEEARLSRAMICIIRGERAAMVEYEVDGHTVAHYRLPAERNRPGDRRIRAVRQEGVAIARWSDASFEHALVAALAEERLLELAREIAASGPRR